MSSLQSWRGLLTVSQSSSFFCLVPCLVAPKSPEVEETSFHGPNLLSCVNAGGTTKDKGWEVGSQSCCKDGGWTPAAGVFVRSSELS